MYNVILVLHNWLRWVVVILAVLAVGRAYWGWFGKKAYTGSDRKLGVAFTSALDTQVLLGLILSYSLAPLVCERSSMARSSNPRVYSSLSCTRWP